MSCNCECHKTGFKFAKPLNPSSGEMITCCECKHGKVPDEIESLLRRIEYLEKALMDTLNLIDKLHDKYEDAIKKIIKRI